MIAGCTAVCAKLLLTAPARRAGGGLGARGGGGVWRGGVGRRETERTGRGGKSTRESIASEFRTQNGLALFKNRKLRFI